MWNSGCFFWKSANQDQSLVLKPGYLSLTSMHLAQAPLFSCFNLLGRALRLLVGLKGSDIGWGNGGETITVGDGVNLAAYKRISAII